MAIPSWKLFHMATSKLHDLPVAHLHTQSRWGFELQPGNLGDIVHSIAAGKQHRQIMTPVCSTKESQILDLRCSSDSYHVCNDLTVPFIALLFNGILIQTSAYLYHEM